MKQLPPLPQEVIDRITSNLDKIEQVQRAKACEIMGKVNGIDVLVAAELYGYVRYYSELLWGKPAAYVCRAENWKPHYKESDINLYCNNLIQYIIDKLGMILLSDLQTILNPKVKYINLDLNSDKVIKKKIIVNGKCQKLLVSKKVHDEMEKGIIPHGIQFAKKSFLHKNRPPKEKVDRLYRKPLKDATYVEHEAIRIFLSRFPEMRCNLTEYECKYIINRYEHFQADNFLGMDKHIRITTQVDRMCRLLGWNERTHKPTVRPSIISTERRRYA